MDDEVVYSYYSTLKRQLEQKWRALDTFEASVKKLELTRQQWRTKYAQKDGELEAAKVSITFHLSDVARYLVMLRADGSPGSRCRPVPTARCGATRINLILRCQSQLVAGPIPH